MNVHAVNIATPTQIFWNGKTEHTGIYKIPVQGAIRLEKSMVAGDTIANRKVHGGLHKACYLFSVEQYPYWKALYPQLEWNWGMFGENLTLAGMNESKMRIGDTYRIGEALVQVSQPREPCYKLGLRFGSQQILKEFIAHAYPGAYVRVLREGAIRVGDAVTLEVRSANPLTVKQCFELFFVRNKPLELLQLALENPALPEHKKIFLRKFT